MFGLAVLASESAWWDASRDRRLARASRKLEKQTLLEAQPRRLPGDALPEGALTGKWTFAVQIGKGLLEVYVPGDRKVQTPGGDEMRVPDEAATGTLVRLAVPEAACASAWSVDAGEDAEYEEHRPRYGGSDNMFVRVPLGMSEGEAFYYFFEGRPTELIVPGGAGGGAVLRLPSSPDAINDSRVPRDSDVFF